MSPSPCFSPISMPPRPLFRWGRAPLSWLSSFWASISISTSCRSPLAGVGFRSAVRWRHRAFRLSFSGPRARFSARPPGEEKSDKPPCPQTGLDTMKLIQITDIHLVRPGKKLFDTDPGERLRLCLADIARCHADADLVVVTGDLAHNGE